MGRACCIGARRRSEFLDGNRYGEQGQLILANADSSNPTVLGRAGDLPWAVRWIEVE
ncbi:MAG: hypothetical protein IPM17_11670 [Verrucomicrobia bacterium]|jgi:hypothetical protein|nr:hypothetical protein [Verrucomicrobiota bacterium]